jgi:hypothetical protein
MMQPVVVEVLVLSLMGFSGVSAGLLLGIRQWIVLAFFAVAASTLLRTWSAFAVWSLGRPEWAFDAWVVISLVVLAPAVALRFRQWRAAGFAVGLFGLGSIAAIATKYVLGVGERHHSDSASMLSMAIFAIQGEFDDTAVIADSYKRGISYPLMLALGPEGRILSAYTPLVYFALLLAAGWIAWKLLAGRVSPRVFAVVVGGVGVFSLTVPMFRAAMSYLNAHTLMGFATVLLVGGFLIARQEQRFSAIPMAFTLVGGALGTTVRVEGIVLVLVVIIALVGQRWWSGTTSRLQLFTALSVIGLTFTWWLASLDSPVIERLALPDSAFGLLVLVTLAGAGLAASTWIDPIRAWLLPAAATVLLALLARVVWQSSNPIGTVLAQWPNLGLGTGGWGTAAHVFIGSAVLLGIRRRSTEYRWLLGLSVLLIVAVLFSKTFDGSFGREGFYDSVNRMWLHVMPTILVATLVGYAEALQAAMGWRRRQDQPASHKTPLPSQPVAQ